MKGITAQGITAQADIAGETPDQFASGRHTRLHRRDGRKKARGNRKEEQLARKRVA